MGSIFYVTSTGTAPIPFTETGSTYQNNQATYGGAIYCDWCTLSISANTIFQYNYAR